MNQLVVVVIAILGLIAGLGLAAYVVYKGKLRRAKAIERGLKMVPLLIHLPPPTSDTESGGRDVREVMREKTAQAEVLYNLIAGTAQAGFKSKFYGQRHIALEIIATDGLIHYYAAVPVNMVSVVENAILSSYPGAHVEEAEDHNIFSEKGKLIGTMGGEIVLKANSAYPIANYSQMERDPMEAILTAMGGITPGNGAAIQIMMRPADKHWVKLSEKLARKLRKGRVKGLKFTAADLAKAAVKAPSETPKVELTNLELAAIEAVENKTKQPGFEVLIRIVVSTESVATSQGLIQKLATAFALFEQPGLNGFKYLPANNSQGLVTAFILRFFPPALNGLVLNTEELATVFHIPDSQFIATSNVERQQTKQVDGPVSVPTSGLLFGYNEFRGVKKEIRLSDQDRRRHTYIIGQTGTGKSTMLENLVAQDLMNGNGFAFIDPHGDTAEKFMGMIPKERAEDVIYFNPSDMEDPLGLNLFEFTDPMQKDFLIQESLSMLYKIYDPEKTGIIGPRFEQWYRNAALTLMSDPNGATFIEIPKVFTDTEYLKNKFKFLKDPTVIEFWTKEMGQTSEYHKSEMLGFFVSKFGAFQQNEMMRNIIGQTESSFNMREIMDKKKILIVNLSKGKIGEMNSKLLGMMFVIKFQAAAMSRADMPEDQRNDFSLYVDEFQNFSTDSFASILSEARKYRLNLIVANQFIGQLTPEVRDAVFGNVGTIIAHRTGPEDAEFMVKQFAPVFDTRDLVNIPNFMSAVRLMIGGLPSQPFSMNDLPPVAGENVELAAAMKELSAAKYGHPRAQVEADITARLTNKPVPAHQSVPAAPTEETKEATDLATVPTPEVVPAAVADMAFTQVAVAENPALALDATPQAPEVSAQAATQESPKNTLSIADLKRPIPQAPVESITTGAETKAEALPGAAGTNRSSEVVSAAMINDAQDEIDSLLSTSLLGGVTNMIEPAEPILPKPTDIIIDQSNFNQNPDFEAVKPESVDGVALVPNEALPAKPEPVATPESEIVAEPAEMPQQNVSVSSIETAAGIDQSVANLGVKLIEEPVAAAPTGEVLASPLSEAPIDPVVDPNPALQPTVAPAVDINEVKAEPAPAISELSQSPQADPTDEPAPDAALIENVATLAPDAVIVAPVSPAETKEPVATAPILLPDLADIAATIASEAGVVEPAKPVETITEIASTTTMPMPPEITITTPEAPVSPAEPAIDPAIPELAPGEIFVDDNGVVHQG